VYSEHELGYVLIYDISNKKHQMHILVSQWNCLLRRIQL